MAKGDGGKVMNTVVKCVAIRKCDICAEIYESDPLMLNFWDEHFSYEMKSSIFSWKYDVRDILGFQLCRDCADKHQKQKDDLYYTIYKDANGYDPREYKSGKMGTNPPA